MSTDPHDPATGRPSSGTGTDPEGGGVAEFRRRALAFGFGIISLGILALLIAIYLQLVDQILWASTLAALFYPLHRRISSLVGGRITLAASISTVISILILFVPAILTVFNLVSEVRNVLPALTGGAGSAEMFQRLSVWLEGSPFRSIAHILVGQGSDRGALGLETEIARAAAWIQEFLLTHLKSVTKSAPAAAFEVAVTIVAYFFFLRHGPGWIRTIQQALPLEEGVSERLIGIAGQTVNAVFRGVILTAAAQALLAGLGFWIAGARVPILLGGLTFIASLIPFVGAVAVWLPTCVFLLVGGHTAAAIGLAVWGTLVVSLADNFLKPYLIGREMRLPTLWLFLAIIGALRMFGFLGLILGPAALSLAFACYRIYAEARRSPADWEDPQSA